MTSPERLATSLLLEVVEDPPPQTSMGVLLCRRVDVDLGVDGTAMTGPTEGQLLTVAAASDHRSGTLVDVLLATGEGPSYDAILTGEAVQQPDLAVTGPPRWPRYTDVALAHGIRAVFAFPVTIGAIRLGTMVFVRDRPGALSPDAWQVARAFSSAASLVLLHLAEGTTCPREFDRRSLDLLGAGPVVHQATGIAAVQTGTDLRDALLQLRAHAVAEGLPLGQLAERVVTGQVRIADDDGIPGNSA